MQSHHDDTQRTRPLLLVLAVVIFGLSPSSLSAIEFHESIEEARGAQQKALPLVISFGASWCGWCHKMDTETFADAQVEAIAGEFLWVKIDVDEQQELAARYRVRGLPQTTVLDADDRVIGSHAGFMPADELIKFVNGSVEHPQFQPEDELALLLKNFRKLVPDDDHRELVVKLVERLAQPARGLRKEALAALEEKGTLVWPLLGEMLSDSRLAVRATAATALSRYTKAGLPFDPFDTKDARAEQTEIWQAWLAEHAPPAPPRKPVVEVAVLEAKSASDADTAVLKQLLATAAAWDAQGRTAIDAATHKQFEEQIGKLADEKLRGEVTRLLGPLETAAVHYAAIRQLQADLKTINPREATKIEPGGPESLRKLVGDEAMLVFSQLAAVSTDDGRGPHDKDYKLEDRVTDAWVERLAPFTELRTLSLANSVLKGDGLKTVGKLANLESLNLTSIPLADAPLEHLTGLKKLRVMGLASTQCTGEGCRHLVGSPELENLNLHNTPVNDAGLEQIGKLKSLKRLEVVHTHFTDAGARHLASLVNLERLQLGSRDATAAALEPLKDLGKLRELDVHDITLTPHAWQTLGGLTNLVVLRVYSGAADDSALESLGKLANLTTLTLASPQVTDAGLAHLAGASKLTRLEIQGSKLSDEAVEKLRERLPNLQVVR